jgi:hypothetical protein
LRESSLESIYKYFEYHLDIIGSTLNSANPAGILGANIGDSNCFIAHGLYYTVANLYFLLLNIILNIII